MMLVSRRSPDVARGGFTLVELLVVMSIFVVLLVMTVGVINLGLTGERVRSAARGVQSKLEGARDRAIYNSRRDRNNPRPVGVRLLVDETITEGDPPRGFLCTSMVYIESPGNEESTLDVNDLDQDGDRSEPALFVQLGNTTLGTVVIGAGIVTTDGTSTPPNWATLYDRGLIGPGSRIRIRGGTDESYYTVHPQSFPIRDETYYQTQHGAFGTNNPNGNDRNDDPVLILIGEHPDAPSSGISVPLEYSIPLAPDVMAGETPLQLPRGTCISLRTSHLPDGWMTINPSTGLRQFSNQMDIMFSAKGTVIGDAAASGIIHLHLMTIADALQNVRPGSQTVPRDIDGDGVEEYPLAEFPVPPDRQGDELGITIFTKSGRTITHPIAVGDAYPDKWSSGQSYAENEFAAPVVYNGLIFQVMPGQAGTSGAAEPRWNLAPGGLTRDNGIIWRSLKHDVWALALEGEVAR